MPKRRPRGIPPICHSTNRVHWVADFLRKERVRQQITQLKLADAADVEGSTIGQFELGTNNLAVFNTIERILAALGYELHIRRKK